MRKIKIAISKVPVLFIGQCKNGSNSMTDFLVRQKGFIEGENVKASCRERIEGKDYFSNWANVGLINAKYLIDKSLVIPDKEYYRNKGDIKRNKVIYIIRNPYLGIKSHFLVALRGETCYSKFLASVPREYLGEKDILNLSFKQACVIIERNLLKIGHAFIVPKIASIFPPENIFFTTLEDLIKGREEFKRLESFLGVKFSAYSFPHKGKTVDKYKDEPELYAAGLKVFNKYSKRIYDRYIIKDDWDRLSVYFKADLVRKYKIC